MSSPPRDIFGNVTGPMAAQPLFGKVSPARREAPMVMPISQGRNELAFEKEKARGEAAEYFRKNPEIGMPFSRTIRSTQAFPVQNEVRKLQREAFPAGPVQVPARNEVRKLQREAFPAGPVQEELRSPVQVEARRQQVMDFNKDNFLRDLQDQRENPEFMNGLSGMLQDYRNKIASRNSTQANPFAENEQYQALMEYQNSMAPSQEQQDRLSELRTAFEGTGGYKDYRISQMEKQMQQMRQQPRMGMGIGMANPRGMNSFGGFPQRQMPQGIMGRFSDRSRQPYPQPQQNFGYGRPQQNFGYGRPQQNFGYGRPQQNFGGYGGMQQNYGMQRQQPMNYSGYGMQPQQNSYQQYGMQAGGYQQNPYQRPSPQPQQYGGYGMNQGYGGQGGFAPMSNPYQPQQYGNNSNNFSGYGMQQQRFY